MDLTKLHNLLADTTTPIRKGDAVHGTPELVDAIKRGDDELPGGVVTFDMMPQESEVSDGLKLIDCHFITVGVDLEKAKRRLPELVALLQEYPHPDRLAGGPSYIEVGAEIGDQGAAFRLFALGEALGLWQVITPARLGMNGETADQMAGSGFIMTSGYKAAA